MSVASPSFAVAPAPSVHSELAMVNACGANDVGGVVYHELPLDGTSFNTYGSKDGNESGVSGVSVTVIDAYGDSTTVLTDSNGEWSVSSPVFPVRVEFSVPDGFKEGPIGAGSFTSVQFVDSSDCQVNLGIHAPDEFTDTANPEVVAPVAINGGLNDIDPVNSLERFHYEDSGSTPNNTHLATKSEVGAIWGLAYNRSTKTIYSSAFVKRHVAMGPGGIGAIYATENTPPYTTTVWLDMTTLGVNFGSIPDNTTRGLTGAPTDPTHDPAVFSLVGKVGIGDIDISADDTTLYVMNLYDKKVYAVDTQTKSIVASFQTTDPGCSNGEWRPFALKYHEGKVYVGGVCDGTGSGDSSDLTAHVYRIDSGLTSATEVFSFSLDYHPRGRAYTGCSHEGWYTWSDVWPPDCPASGGFPVSVWPQPLLSDIEFDIDGDMILGFGDRFGHQSGQYNYAPQGTQTYSAITGGDILRANYNSDGTYTLEYNATVGGITTDGVNNNEGPGGGEYYYEDRYKVYHLETTDGSLAFLPGRGEIMVTSMDPDMDGPYSNGGVRRFNNMDGKYVAGYVVYPRQDTAYMGKAHGIGDIELLGPPAPIEIGNRVWLDLDNDGIQDPEEPPLSGVTVTLHDPSGTQIGSVVTNSKGEYYFSSDPNGVDTASADYGISELEPFTSGYTIHVDLTQSAPVPLALTTANADSSPNGDARDSDAVQVGNDAVITFDTSSAGSNDHSYDFGFTSVAIGNRVWSDLNHNGLQDANESGIGGVRVDLLDSSGNLIASTYTSAGGIYTFDGLDGVAPNGQYQLRIDPNQPALAGMTLTTQDAGGDTSNDPTDDNDSDAAMSGGVALINPATAPSSGVNYGYDFGFASASIGDYVWFDDNGDGIQDASESGVAGVRIDLLDSNGNPVQACMNTVKDYLDEGGSANASSGSLDWSGQDWNYSSAGASGSGGNPGAMQYINGNGSMTRAVDASAFALYPTLSFDYQFYNGASNSLTVKFSTDGGSTWTTLATYSAADSAYHSESMIFPTISSTAQIRFEGGASGSNQIRLDNIKIEGCIPENAYAITDSNGYYLFDSSKGVLPNENYQLVIDTTQTSLNGYVATIKDAGSDDTVDSDADMLNSTTAVIYATAPSAGEDLTYDFGLTAVNIGDYVWLDSNGNGIQDSGEAGIQGVRVDLLDSNGNPVEACMNTIGDYLDDGGSNNASAGSIDWSDQIWTYVNGAAYSSDGNPGGKQAINGTGRMTRPVDLSVFASNPTISFDYKFYYGTSRPDSFTVEYSTDNGATWTTLATYTAIDTGDANYHSVAPMPLPSRSATAQIRFVGGGGSNQVGLDNIRIAGCIFEPVYDITDADGLYLFGITEGVHANTDYQVVIDTTQAPLDGLDLSPKDAGGDDAVDSDADMSLTKAVINPARAPNSGSDLTFDFGFYRLRIGDRIWRDNDGDGIQDADEPGISGVRVDLLDSSGNPVQGCMNTLGDYLDEGGSANASSGSIDWSGQNWDYNNAGPYSAYGNPGGMHAINSGNASMTRSVDLSAFATYPDLSFDYQFYYGDSRPSTLIVEYSPDDGATWVTLGTYEPEDDSYHTATGLRMPSLSSTAKLRFSHNDSNSIRLDNIKIEGCIPEDVYEITDANGYYHFDSIKGVQPSSQYQVVVDTTQSALSGLTLTTQDAGSDDEKDSDAGTSGNKAVISSATSPSAGEDLSYDIGFHPPIMYDWGDLPDSFATDQTDSGEGVGPSHVITSTLYLGSCVDAESDGQPDNHAGADSSGGDDNNTGSVTGSCTGNDDEDGVKLVTPLAPGAQSCFEVTAHNGANKSVDIYAWIDWNGDGDFGSGSTVDADEAFKLGSVPANTDWTNHKLCTIAPSGATFDGGETHMRFRFSSDALTDSDWGGQAGYGEVEDYWQPLVCVGNYLWMDVGSTDDVQDSDDAPVADGTQVYLVWEGPDGDIDAISDNVTYTTTTTSGVYKFCGLVPDANGDSTNDDYQISVPTLPGTPVARDVGGDDALDNDGDNSGVGPVFTVSIPTSVSDDAPNDTDPNNFPDDNTDLTFDFGFEQDKVAIGNRVWSDDDKNSMMNGSEAGIDGVKVELYQDKDGDGVCEPGGDDGSTALDSTTTANDGYYQFLDLTPSAANDLKTCYCVAIPKSSVSGYTASSAGWTSDPDSTDENSGQGDDGYPSGSYVVTKPICAEKDGQTNTSDAGDPAGYPDASAYMTVDFGFHSDQPNAVSLSKFAGAAPSETWMVIILLSIAAGVITLAWRRRRAM